MKALYRKYRPKSLSEVVGQEAIVSSLENALKNNKISHAYLFTGPRGTGKTSVARIFAHAVNDFKYELEDFYPDIIEIDAASNNGVENIRDIREKSIIAPTSGKYKVYIVDEVHMLSKAAFNALLKTLEEPPKHVIFILATTDFDKVPVTITSRVQVFNFQLASTEAIKSHLKKICKTEKIEIEDSALDLIIRRGGGSFRDTLSLLDQLSNLKKDGEKLTLTAVESAIGIENEKVLENLISVYKAGDLNSISDALSEVINRGTKPEALAEELLDYIIAHPKRELLPLLSALPNVRAPFPEAKLLLAFCGEISPIQPTMKTPAFIQKPKINSAPVQAEKLAEKDSISASKDESKPSPIKTEVKEAPISTPKNSDFSWEEFLEQVHEKSPNTLRFVENSNFRVTNSELHLFPDSKQAKVILSAKGRLDIFAEILGDRALVIHDPSENPENSNEKDPNIQKINDIMGATQEVKNGGEIPF